MKTDNNHKLKRIWTAALFVLSWILCLVTVNYPADHVLGYYPVLMYVMYCCAGVNFSKKAFAERYLVVCSSRLLLCDVRHHFYSAFAERICHFYADDDNIAISLGHRRHCNRCIAFSK